VPAVLVSVMLAPWVRCASLTLLRTRSQPGGDPRCGSTLPGGYSRGAGGRVAGMGISEVAVVGLGTMGAGIAEVLARGGLRVTAIEADPPALIRSMGILDGSLARAVARGRLTGPEQAGVFGRI